MTSQRIEKSWETPTQSQIIDISRAHVEMLETSNADDVWQPLGMHHVILTTTGRRSGRKHKCALPVWRDASGHRMIVGSFAGADKEPDWLANLRDATEVTVQTQSGEYVSVPEILEGEERDSLWSQLCEDRPWYNDYQELTERVFPLIRLIQRAL